MLLLVAQQPLPDEQLDRRRTASIQQPKYVCQLPPELAGYVSNHRQQRDVACDDIGKAVAVALVKPDEYRGKTVTICGQAATVDELEVALEKGEGQKGWGRMWMPRWLIIRMTPRHYRQMFDVSHPPVQVSFCWTTDTCQWLYYDICQPSSVEETRAMIGDVMDIETWARRQKAKQT